ncbi:MAG: YhfG family protein [Verrucomicrobiota bacterium]|jgi:hypothetical protein
MKASSLIAGLLAGSAIGAGTYYLLAPKTPPPAPVAVSPAPKPSGNGESERIARLEKELAALMAEKEKADQKPAETASAPAEDGKPDLGKILKDASPLLKSLSSAFEPQRKEMVARFIDSQVQRLTEMAGLSESQAAALRTHLETMDKENQEKMQSAMGKDMKLEDLIAMRRNGGNNPQKAVDDWAAANLSGDQAESYKAKRLTEKSEQITRSANAQLDGLDRELSLSEEQKDKVFNVLVQTDQNYDASMKLEGIDATASVGEGQSRDDAIAAILSPDQKAKYDARQTERKSRESRFMQMLGVDPAKLRQE